MSDISDFPLSPRSFIRHEGQFWLTARSIGEALGYEDPSKVLTIFERNKEELEEYSISLKLRAVDGKSREQRIFNEEGLYIISMLARTDKAKLFRRAVAKLLKELRRKQTDDIRNSGISLGLELNSLADVGQINRVCYYRNLGLTQTETSRLTALSPQVVSNIEARLKELGVNLKQLSPGTRRKHEINNTLKNLLGGDYE